MVTRIHEKVDRSRRYRRYQGTRKLFAPTNSRRTGGRSRRTRADSPPMNLGTRVSSIPEVV